MPLSAEAVKFATGLIDAAPEGGRTAAVREAARRLGVSPAALYRALPASGSRRPRPPRRPEYRGWVRTALALAHRAPEPAPLELAIEAAVKGGDLPPEAAGMPLGTAYRVARELGLDPGVRRRSPRVVADYPMQAVLIDASTSKRLVVDKRADPGDDDPPVRLYRAPTPASGYKNKPLPPDRRRLVVYGVWDMCTGLSRSRYVAATGENALDALDFLLWAFTHSPDRRVVMHGVPDDLWSDQGPLVHNAAAVDLIKRLEIDPKLAAPYAKSRMGGVERAHRTRWGRFEAGLFLGPDRPLRVSDINARLLEFEVAENGRRLSRTPVDGREVSRTAAWSALVRRRPAGNPLRALPENPMETLAVEARRRVDVAGLVRWGGKVYECAWHDRTVIARRAADGSGGLALEDEATGERCAAEPYEPRAYGDIRAGAATPAERLRDDPAARDLAGADVWAPAAGPPAVVPMPAPAAPPSPLPNPLEVGVERCRDVADAWRVFSAVYPWPVPAELRTRIEGRFHAAGLARAGVVELAQDLAAAMTDAKRRKA